MNTLITAGGSGITRIGNRSNKIQGRNITSHHMTGMSREGDYLKNVSGDQLGMLVHTI